MSKLSIGVAIVTYQAESHLRNCLNPLVSLLFISKILVIDSSSTDQTVKIAKEFGVEVKVIPKHTFNHGLTRDLARKELNTDIVVFFTQDAYLQTDLFALIKPIVKGSASLSYARQIPRKNAGFFESFAREMLYPAKSEIRELDSSRGQGVAACFFSNSCAAYLNLALDEVAGFGSVVMGEDTVAAAKLLLKGHSLAYVAETEVEHSHSFGLIDEFKRYFLIGKYRKQHRKLFLQFGNDGEKGRTFALSMFSKLVRTKPWLLPYGFLYLLAKWAGYRLGSSNLIQNDVKI